VICVVCVELVCVTGFYRHDHDPVLAFVMYFERYQLALFPRPD